MIQFIYLESLNYVPSSAVFYEALRKREPGEVQITDPGTCSIQELKRRIDQSEVIIMDVSMIIAMGLKPLSIVDFYIIHSKPRDYYFDVWETIYNSSKPLFIFSPSSDLTAINFGLDRNHFLDLLKRSDGIFWPYFRCPVKAGTIPEKYNSILPSVQLNDYDLVKAWEEIKNTIKISIDLPHCISRSEAINSTKRKKWDIIVPGTGYATRRIALTSAEESGLKVTPFESIRRWQVTAPYFLYKNFLSKRKAILLQQKRSFVVYRDLISRSAVTFTCGSELKYFVRKFLEVPAFRSAMIAYPSDNLRDYGFEDGIHFLSALPEETAEKAKFLLKNSETADRMIMNAWELVVEKHNAEVRVNQVMECVNSFMLGKIKSAGYFLGKFEIQ